MLHTKSESDVTSLAPSSPSSMRAMYYVQSPSRDSHDGDKSMQTTVTTPSPMDSPTHPSHSRASSASRFSGTFTRKPKRSGLVNEKGWPECNVIKEEGPYDDLDGDAGMSRRCQIVLAFVGFVLLFTAFCLITWGASRPYKPSFIIKSMSVDNFYSGEGTDATGVVTKLITVNCSLKISVYNPASTYGIHVTSSEIILIYSQITIGTGQLKKYYQPRKSHRIVTAVVQGVKVPLYGAGAGLPLSTTGGPVPLTLDFEILSRGYVVGKLVTVKHRKRASCSLVIDSNHARPLKFSQSSCMYN